MVDAEGDEGEDDEENDDDHRDDVVLLNHFVGGLWERRDSRLYTECVAVVVSCCVLVLWRCTGFMRMPNR
jgi:hypothetical protein